MDSSSYASALGAGFSITYTIVCLVIAVFILVGMWKVFEKGGKPGWAVLIPIYNLYCLYEIAFGVGWLFLLTFIPCVGAVISIILQFKLAKAFGKGIGFGFGLLFLSPIFYIILGFDESYYVGPQ